MIVTGLRITNLRAIEAAEFKFQAGVNLIVGVNGVGKTTVLHAISRGLAHAIRVAGVVKTTPPPITESDIRLNSLASNVTLDLQLGGLPVQVAEDWTLSETFASRPGELASEVDVHEKDLRRGWLRQAQREAQKTQIRETGPRFYPSAATFKSNAKRELSRVVSVYFSTTRAVAPARVARKNRAVPASVAAYTDAFVGRELGLGVFAEWLKVLGATAAERDDAGSITRALNKAVRRFLPGYLGLRASGDDPPRLLIDRTERRTLRADELSLSARQLLVKVLRRMREHMDVNWSPEQSNDWPPTKVAEDADAERVRVVENLLKADMNGFEDLRGPLEKIPTEISKEEYFNEFFSTLGTLFKIDQLPESLDVTQLSEGERGSLALVLDLTRRLAQANPMLRDPASESEAVVLIDEIELHLHPKWQRTILQSLTVTFPKCQFIATTHSPQVIGEVEHNRIQIIADGMVYSPNYSYGVDSSRVLNEIMDAEPRAMLVNELLSKISGCIGSQHYDEAHQLLVKLIEHLGQNDPEVIRISTLLDFVQGKE